MSNTKHTPLPWAVNPCQPCEIGTLGVEDEIYTVAVTGTNGVQMPYDDNPAENAANAALIVRAVNNHAALVEALEAAESQLVGMAAWLDATGQKEVGNGGRNIAANIRAALAAARE